MRDRRRFLRDGAVLALGWAGSLPAADKPPKAEARVTAEGRKAAEAGLKFLAEQQAADGSFGTGNFKGNVGVTGLGALAFLAGGHQPDGQGNHRRSVLKALRFVLAQEQKQPAGFLHNPAASPHGPMYGHAYGTLFLAKLLGHVPDKEEAARLKATLERAVGLSVACQNGQGGWRYTPASQDADLSVTGTQALALRAARDAGLEVNRDTLAKAAKYAVACQNEDGSFRYMAQGGGGGSLSRAGLGLDVLLSAGRQETPEFARGLKYLLTHKPGGQQPRPDFLYFPGHLHAARVLCAVGGAAWAEWYAALAGELLPMRQPDGSWKDQLCPHFATAVACLLLLMPDGVLFGA